MGNITDIERDSYKVAEKEVIEELNKIGKPFIVVLLIQPIHIVLIAKVTLIN